MVEIKFVADIRYLGDPILRAIATPVDSFVDAEFANQQQRLYATLLNFRRRNNFGRAISAPQIGYGKRLIAMHLKGERHIIVNPEITWESSGHLTMWDDCMSFPSLLVRLERARSSRTNKEGKLIQSSHMVRRSLLSQVISGFTMM